MGTVISAFASLLHLPLFCLLLFLVLIYGFSSPPISLHSRLVKASVGEGTNLGSLPSRCYSWELFPPSSCWN